MYAENDILFPYAAIISLQDLRGEAWGALVAEVSQLPETHEKTLALMLTMVRLNGCMTCETDSYRAMRGCAACAIQQLRRFKGSDDDLLDMYARALRDIRNFSENNPQHNVISA